MMKYFQALYVGIDNITARWIDHPAYQEHELTCKSFITGELPKLEVGKFYRCVRRFDESYKLSCIALIDETVDEVADYLKDIAILAANTESGERDPVVKLRKDAQALKYVKGRDNPFFKNYESVMVWLLQKNRQVR